jgi:probable HAF family extracellular repeat protein
MLDLGTLSGGFSAALDINNRGQIVGDSNNRAFLYQDGSMYDLNSLIDPSSGWVLESASAINDSGQIVGYGINSLGQEHAFLLSQIPEPTMLLPLGLVALALKRKIQKPQ